MTAVDAQALAETVRRGIVHGLHGAQHESQPVREAAAALDGLVKALGKAQRGIIEPPYAQVIGRNAVVLLTRPQIQRIRDDYGNYPAGSPVTSDIYGEMGMALIRLDAAPVPVRGDEPRIERREGMVTVYDYEGRYVGCMGVETWRAAIREGVTA